ncbi:(R)-citramalate synthase [Olavius algarvensis spirochete endosymbiont]|nr:(R)-citramalate synthase [Olavius algarvensis spirochete endosymbiont]
MAHYRVLDYVRWKELFMSKKGKIILFDTTLRDGGQTGGVHFSVEDKIKLSRELDEMGFEYIEGGWPGSNPKDIRYFEEMKKVKLKHSKLSSFSSTRLKDTRPEKDKILAELLRVETPVFTIFGKSWDLHVKESLETSLEENLEMIHSTIAFLKPRCDEIVYDAEHFFDGFKANPKYAIQTLKAAASAGADWIVLADTNGGALPEEIHFASKAAFAAVDKPIGIHTHDDGDLSLANTLVAVELGAKMVQGTINGLGERCGNANLCSIIPTLSLKLGYETLAPEKIVELTRLSWLVSELSNKPHQENLPYVGDRAYTHKGGIHVSAVRKNPKLYEHLNPELVGNERRVPVSDQAGKSNVLQKASDLGMKIEDAHAKTIVAKVKELESQGYHFEGADASFELLSDDLTGRRREFFKVHGFRVHTWENDKGEIWSEATIRVSVPEAVAGGGGHNSTFEHTAAEGSGPVEAMDRALHKALENFYPSIRDIRLTDFKVRILDEEAGTKAVTRVLISSTDGHLRWSTVGVSQNIIEASWRALVESIEFKLKKHKEA